MPTKYAHRQITIVASVNDVRLIFEDRLIARHRWHWGKHEYLFDPVHYLALLERKPGGFDFARPLEHWELRQRAVLTGLHQLRDQLGSTPIKTSKELRMKES